MLTVIIRFCLVPFLFTTVLFCLLKLQWINRQWSCWPTQERHRTFHLEHKICGDDADEGTLQITTGDRGATQWACATGQWGNQWLEEEPQGAEGCIWERSCSHQGETEQCVVPSGTDSRCNNPHADETWLCGRWWHWRWSKGLEAFAREISECGDADSGDFSGTACSTAARGFWGFGQLLHQRTGVAHKATRSRWSSLRDPLQRLSPQWSANEVWTFCYTGKLQPGNELYRVEEKAAEHSWEHSAETQGTKWFSGTGSEAWLQEGTKKGNCFVCGIPGNFAKDCRKKETAQCSKCGEKGHLDRACKRQRDGGKHESVAMGPILAKPDQECWAALTQWKTAGMLVDSGCTDHIVTNIDAFLDFVPIQSVVRNPNGEASRVVDRGCLRINVPSNKGEFQCELKNVLCVLDYSSNLLSVSSTEWGHSFTFERGNSCMKLQKGTRVKLTHENNLFYLPCSVLEFKLSSNSVKLDSARKWHRRLGHLNQADVVRNAPETVGELHDVCNVCALAKITKTPVPRVAETQAEEKLERVFTDVMEPFRVESLSGFRFCIVFADQYTKFVFMELLKAKIEALASLKKFVLSVGTPKKLRQDNAKEFLRAVQDVLLRCRHSTGEDHTRDATTEWVSWEVQQDTAGDGKTFAHWLRTSQDDVGSSNSSRSKDQKFGCETRRRKMPSRADERYKT